MQHNGPKHQGGLLISFDGVDSSGKETQAGLLQERLEKEGYIVHKFETPDYSTPSGQELKLRLQGKLGNWEEISWQEKLGYFANNRMEHKQEVLEALEKGEVVIYDRYVPSSITFMSMEAGEYVRAEVERVEYEQNSMPKENLSVFLDMPPQVADRLLKIRKDEKAEEDEYTDNLEVQQTLYDHYQKLLVEKDNIVKIACVRDDNLMSIEDIHAAVWEEVAKLLN